MFNKKRKAAEKQARLAQRAEAEEKFAIEIAEAQKNSDPAEQLLKLDEIRGNIQYYAWQISQEIKQKDNVWLSKVAGGGVMLAAGSACVVVGAVAALPATATAAVIAASVAGHVGNAAIVSFLSSLPVVATGTAVNGPANRRAIRKRTIEAADHVQRIAALEKQATDAKDALLQDRPHEITQSSSFPQVLMLRGMIGKFTEEQVVQSPSFGEIMKVPELAAVFGVAAAKQVEKLKREAGETYKATQQRQRDAAPRPSLDRYDRLKDPFGYKK